MLIPVNLSLPIEPAAGPSLPPQLVKLGSSEVALIELQGSLQIAEGEDPATGLHVGTLHMDATNKPTLRIGAHLLEGKVVTLPKPLALLMRDRKERPDDPSALPDVEYNTVALIKKKIVFAKRPMPIPNARPPQLYQSSTWLFLCIFRIFRATGAGVWVMHDAFTNPVQPSSAARTRGWSVCLAVVLLLLFWYLPVPSATLRKTPAGSTYRGRVKNDFDWNQLEASPKFNWVPCYAAFQCAKFEVPLDYTEPDGPKASIAVLKRPSKFPPDDSRHRGAIFYNPGGPGASGVNFLSRVAALFVEIIGDDFDHVSFDPRGVGRSTPAPIVFKSEAELRAWEAKDFNSLNYTADGVGRTLALAEVQGRLALQRASRSAAHLGTADVARDIVAMNAALGRDKIQYWGGSYGTILGVTLAAMYPNKIERMVIDSVMEASTYYRTTWDRNLLHTDDALDWFFTSCSASPACPLHESSPGAVRARYDRIVDGLKQRPIAAVQGDVYGVVDWPLLRNMIFPWLYKPYATFPQLAQTLADLEKGDGTLAYTLSGRDDSTWTCSGNDQPVGGSLSYSVVNSAILCGDGDPVDASLEELQTWHRVQASLSIFADLHPVRIWCAGWKIRAKNPFTGSLSANTSHPIFLMGTTADPVAPLESAHETAKRFPGSVVLGVEAPGHGAILVPSVCMAKHLRAYMREGTLPPAGTLCKADRTIFPTDQDLSSLSAADRRLLAASEQLAATIQFPRLI